MTVYYADITPLFDEDYYQRIYNQIPKWRKDKADVYKVKGAKCLSVGASFLLVKSLEELGLSHLCERVVISEDGKPYFDGVSNLYFNLSHSEKMVMCVVSDCEIGCDIQYCDRKVKGIADRFYTEGEQAYMYEKTDTKEDDAGEINDRFYRIWTRKEAYIKLTGEGLKKSFETFDVFNLDAHFFEDRIGDYRLCVASKEPFPNGQREQLTIKEYLWT